MNYSHAYMLYYYMFYRHAHTCTMILFSAHLFLSQKMDAKEPEKKMPSTAANAMILSPKVAVRELIHFRAQSAFFLTHGTEGGGRR